MSLECLTEHLRGIKGVAIIVNRYHCNICIGIDDFEVRVNEVARTVNDDIVGQLLQALHDYCHLFWSSASECVNLPRQTGIEITL